ncbi:hypothetical protein PIB30_036171 [Stylosanthes scabra]|uniref:Uncharacterized protein n=1 Tax=Stylosanthes scabra TaxID=79078 RepID=A0ABU6QDU2_9FABA|nr:hypothetical protein [Stylosanthes scabra]
MSGHRRVFLDPAPTGNVHDENHPIAMGDQTNVLAAIREFVAAVRESIAARTREMQPNDNVNNIRDGTALNDHARSSAEHTRGVENLLRFPQICQDHLGGLGDWEYLNFEARLKDNTQLQVSLNKGVTSMVARSNRLPRNFYRNFTSRGCSFKSNGYNTLGQRHPSLGGYSKSQRYNLFRTTLLGKRQRILGAKTDIERTRKRH